MLDPRMQLNILRRNWFFVPRTPIADLLCLREEELETILDRDAFYRAHLGPQPKFPRVRLTTSTVSESSIAYFRDPDAKGIREPRFGFEGTISKPVRGFMPPAQKRPLIIAYPYYCPFGDVLADPNCLSYYPPGLLQRMSNCGVSAIWLHALLRDLVPNPFFQDDYPSDPARNQRLRQIILLCQKAGLGVYLYLDEPRGARDSFYRSHPDMRGAPGRKGDGLWCMCTTSEQTRRFLRESSERLFRSHPLLQGAILITASENPTHCYSLTRHTACSRCSRRSGTSVIGEVVREIATGAKAAKQNAHIIAWDWSWGIVEDDPQAGIIRALPDGVSLLVDFERGSQIVRGGVRSQVDEYSLSTTGPSLRAVQHLQLARERGLATLGKAQIGTTWEIGTLTFLAIPDLVADKIKALQKNGLHEGMFSWALGAYPSLNWDVLARLVQQPAMPSQTAIRQVARERYGEGAADLVVACWSELAQIFRRYPFSTSVVYSSFVQKGPATPLFAKSSGRQARILNSFDSLRWTAPFGPKRVTAIFGEMGQQWKKVADRFTSAQATMNGAAEERAKNDARIIEAAGLYFESIALLIRFYEMREQPRAGSNARLRNVEEQLRVTERFLALCRADSRIGFEAAAGYMYLPLDIREKIAVCRYLLRERPKSQIL